uniref:Uncharacterized protein n=1 Tax=Anguilla anguilla TaxID=7936 RepID=A0A0E9R4D5_ANGAN
MIPMKKTAEKYQNCSSVDSFFQTQFTCKNGSRRSVKNILPNKRPTGHLS